MLCEVNTESDVKNTCMYIPLCQPPCLSVVVAGSVALLFHAVLRPPPVSFVLKNKK